jgi:hemolysin III
MDFHDRISSSTHLLMAVWAVFASAFVLRLSARHTRSQRVSVVVYAVMVVTLYTASGLFHGIRHATEEGKRVWQLLDQSAIFGLILGSNVPMLVYLVPRRPRNRVLAIMTGIAVVGVGSLWLLPSPPHELLVAVYIGMGILGFLPIRYYFARLGWSGMLWIFLLAFFYIAGGVFEAVKWPVILTGQFVLTYHEVLHVCDMAGTVAHYVLLLRVVMMTPPRGGPASTRRPHGPAGFARPACENRTTT